jgi:hypothetical protein
MVARNLGIQYLWVDALCILQDDMVDKLTEISIMNTIYEQAHVTISATRASDVEQGFLHPRHLEKEEIHKLPFLCRDGTQSELLLFRGRDSLRNEPIDARGWTFQESVLSPRVLEYGKHQVRWRCRTMDNSPGPQLVDGWSVYSTGKAREFDRTIRSPDSIGPEFASQEPGLAVSEWKDIVSAYTSRKLSYEEDRLLAISAIARRFQLALKDQYAAGLWRGHIADLLLWESLEPRTPAPREYLAPSWSWASVTGPVAFLRDRSRPRPSGTHPPYFDTQNRGNTQCLDVSHVELKNLRPSDIYGRITRGFLQVKGDMAEATGSRNSSQDMHLYSTNPPVYTLGQGWPGKLDSKVLYDAGEGCIKKLWLLCVERWKTLALAGLVLQELSDGNFRRIGVFEIRNFTDVRFTWESRTVTIV